MTTAYFRDLPPESVSPVTSSHRSEVAPEPSRGRQEPARSLWLTWLREWHRRHRSRTSLSELDERMLKDIGVTYAEAEHEANKQFWLP
jgi:uncharacterized protein YjiS (DUF1127 family)